MSLRSLAPPDLSALSSLANTSLPFYDILPSSRAQSLKNNLSWAPAFSAYGKNKLWSELLSKDARIIEEVVDFILLIIN